MVFAGDGQPGFVPLVPDIPFIGGAWYRPDGLGFVGLLQALIGMSVGLAAVLAVVMLAIGGFKYMTTDSAFKLGDAKEQITNAIIGLLIVLTAVLILNTINPQLTSLDVFGGLRARPLNVTPTPTTPAPNAMGPGAQYGDGTDCPQGTISDGFNCVAPPPAAPTGPGPAPTSPAGGAQAASGLGETPQPPAAAPGG